MPNKVQILAVSAGGGTDLVVHKIRKWCAGSNDPIVETHAPRVTKQVSLQAAVDWIAHRRTTAKLILVPIGFSELEVAHYVSGIQASNLEVIIRPPRPDRHGERSDLPSSSLLEQTRVVNVQNTIPAIRKSLLRLALGDEVRLSNLDTKEQLLEYFRLRYEVWKEMGYLTVKRDCSRCRLEVDYTDGSAIPIGAFSKDNKLIGCARLVFARKDEITDSPDYDQLIKRLIEDENDPGLAQNYQRPLAITHPFDILEGFTKFQRYYRLLVRRRIPKAEVSRVIVSPQYRRQGLGEVLVDTLGAIARKQHLDVLFLACQQQHQGFYQRCGFHPLPGLWAEQFIGVRKPSIAMACNLRKHLPPVVH